MEPHPAREVHGAMEASGAGTNATVERHVATEATELGAEEARTLSKEAYLFGLPLVYNELQIDVMTNVAAPSEGRAPINQFVHYRELTDPASQVIAGLNVDTLYSLAGLDLSDGPLILSVPDMGSRFWVMQLIDAWNNVPYVPGSRTAGGRAGDFAIFGPTWNGTLPGRFAALRMPTHLATLVGRTYTVGPRDYTPVHAIQNGYRLTPLSQWGSLYTPPKRVPLKLGVNRETPVPQQILAMSPETFFDRLNRLLVKNPPFPEDAPIMTRIEELGVSPGARFRLSAFPLDVRQAIERGVAAAKDAIVQQESKLGECVNGWILVRDTGRFGTKYTSRATAALVGIGRNLIDDAFYPVSNMDSVGRPYDSAHKYVLRFTRAQIPPVNAFWSVTMYDTKGHVVPNRINRYALGDRSGMLYEHSGAITIYIQRESPGREKEANWLPAPAAGGFKLVMRLYAPRKPVADGAWAPPPVERIA